MPASAAVVEFRGTISPVDAEMVRTRGDRAARYRSRILRLLTLRYWRFDGTDHRGYLIVHRIWAEDLLDGFREAQFPFKRMVLVDRYQGDDDRSIAASNTSAFNCRR